LAIIQGATSAGTVQFGVLEPVKENFAYRAQDLATGQVFEPREVKAFSRPTFPWRQMTLQFVGLDTKSGYSLMVYRKGKGGEPGSLVDYRRFKTLDVSKENPRIVVASCMDDFYKSEQEMMWKQVAGEKADALFLIGDQVYTDRSGGQFVGAVDPALLWKRYVETRNALHIFRRRELIPVFAIWDDHDYGLNDGDREYPYGSESSQIFAAFFPRAPIAGTYDMGPGLSRRLKAWGQSFFFLDDRTFRSPDLKSSPKSEAKTNGPGQSHLGPAQDEWLQHILDTDPTPAWLVDGDQYFGGYQQFESWEGSHPSDFKAFLTKLKKAKGPFWFVSGDRHLTELMAIEPAVVGYPTYELTTSAIHAKVFPSTWDQEPNPRQIAGAANEMNYAVVESKAVPGQPWALSIRAMGLDGKKLYEKEITIQR
jgi:hypothetical protein